MPFLAPDRHMISDSTCIGQVSGCIAVCSLASAALANQTVRQLANINGEHLSPATHSLKDSSVHVDSCATSDEHVEGSIAPMTRMAYAIAAGVETAARTLISPHNEKGRYLMIIGPF